MSAGDQTAWPKSGPASYFPSIEKNYGRSIADWQDIIRKSRLDKHMEIVNHLKSEYGMGHGHANVSWDGRSARTSRRARLIGHCAYSLRAHRIGACPRIR